MTLQYLFLSLYQQTTSAMKTTATTLKAILAIYILIIVLSFVYGIFSDNAFFVFGLPVLLTLLIILVFGGNNL